jgi:hypothetical protein
MTCDTKLFWNLCPRVSGAKATKPPAISGQALGRVAVKAVARKPFQRRAGYGILRACEGYVSGTLAVTRCSFATNSAGSA